MKWKTCLWLVLITLVVRLPAQPTEAGPNAFDAVKPKAESGNAQAEYGLGNCYYYGQGVSKDGTEAVKWYRKAAEQSYPQAQYALGFCYKIGRGIPEDQTQAIGWYRKAAEQNYPKAEHALGNCYLDGQGVTKDESEAVRWYRKAAEQNYAPAEYDLGVCLENGQGVPKDRQEAVKWYRKAAEQNYAQAEYALGNCYYYGVGVIKDESKAVSWYTKAAEQNYPKAQAVLGNCYFFGRGVERDDLQALVWYEKALKVNPQDQKIKKRMAILSLLVFFKNEDHQRAFNPALIVEAYHKELWVILPILSLISAMGVMVLLYFSFNGAGVSRRITLALGWLAFYLESQFLSVLILCILIQSLTAAQVLGGTIAFASFPVIAASFGKNCIRIWKASEVYWKMILIYCGGGIVSLLVIDFGYTTLYTLITHSPLPLQPTQGLLMQSKDSSFWLAFISVGCVGPITEEIIFRGYLFDALLPHFKSYIVIISTALVFTMIHFQSAYFIPILGIGLLFGWIKFKTDSIRLTVLLHALNNCLAVAMLPDK